jgi:hypothetical protein
MTQTRETIVGAIKSAKGDAFPGLLLDSLAIHESGHAVVAAHLGVRFASVVIDPKPESLASVKPVSPELLESMQMTDEELRDYKLNTVKSLLASRAAIEAFFDPSFCQDEIVTSGYGNDEAHVSDLAHDLHIHPSERAEWRSRLLDEVRVIVKTPYVRASIRVVADAVNKNFETCLRTRELLEVTESEVIEILKRARETTSST